LHRAGVRRVDFNEDLIGWPYHSRRWLLWGRPKTAGSLHNSLYYSLLAHLVDLSRVSTVVDIGGGFGSLLGAVVAKQPHIRGYLVEMPYLCVVAGYYLGRKFGDVDLVDEEPAGGSARVSVMLPWLFDGLTSAPDLAINTMSFQHMAQANHEYYFSNLARLGVKKVFSVNREHDTREGEAPFMPTARKHGFRLDTTIALDPWSDKHRAHLFVA
jgi:putative sugar O-methyltransferase